MIDDAQYYEGIYDGRTLTPSDNLLIRIKDAKIIINNTPRTSKIPTYNFLVPRRRIKLIKKIQNLEENTPITVKLQQETNSKKWGVSEIWRK